MFFGSGSNELLWSLAPVGNGRSVAFGRTMRRTTPDGRTVFESPELRTEEVTDGVRTATWDPDPSGRTTA
jgi:hypothetical protein